MIRNMNEFVYQLLRKTTVLRIFQTPHVHAKFQEYRTSDFGEEDFIEVFTIYGHGGHLGHVT